MFKFLKKLDVFKQATYTFSTQRDKNTNVKKYNRKHGSTIGGALTIVMIICVFSYTSAEINNMVSG